MSSPTTTTSNQNTSQQGTSSGSYTGNTNQTGTSSSTSNTAQNTATSSTTGPAAAAMAILQKYGTNGLSQADINRYLDPNLVSRLSALQGQQAANNAVQQNALKGNAISMGALGGDRAMIAQAELMRGQGLNDASMLSAERSGAYRDALAAAQADRAAALQAAGMMGTTTTGTGSTTGTSSTSGMSSATGTSSGTNQAQSQSTGTSSGTSTTAKPFDPMSLAPLALALLAHGGRVHRGDGGGVGGYIPIPQLTFDPVPSAPAGEGSAQTSPSQMFQLGQKARTGMGNFLDGMQSGKWGSGDASAGLGDRLGAFAGGDSVQGGVLGGLSGLMGFADGGGITEDAPQWLREQQAREARDAEAARAAAAQAAQTQDRTDPEALTTRPGTNVGPTGLSRLGNWWRGAVERSQPSYTAPTPAPVEAPPSPGLSGLAGAPAALAAPAAARWSAQTEPVPSDTGTVVNPVKSFRIPPPASVLAPALGAAPQPVGVNLAEPGAAEIAPPGAVASPANAISDNGVNFLKERESFSSKPYWDAKGNSIGYGTPAQPGETSIDSDEAERRLRAHAGRVSDYLNKNATQPLSQNQHDALVSFGYNLGTGRGGLADVMPFVNRGDFAGAAEKMQQYNHSNGKVLPGLTERRAAEAAMLQGTEVPSGTSGNAPAASATGGMGAGLSKALATGDGRASTAAAATGDRGGLLKRLLGIDFNPLKLSDTERMALLAGGTGGIGAGLDMYKALRSQDLSQGQHQAELALRQQQADQAKQSFAVIGQNPDGTPRYGFVNAAAGTIKPASDVAGSGITTTLPNSNLTGMEYVNTLDPAIAERAKRVVLGLDKLPTPSKYDLTAKPVADAVRHAFPDYNTGTYDFIQKWNDPNKGTALNVKAANTFYEHGGRLYDLAENLPSSSKGHFANSIQNWFNGQMNDPNLAAFLSVAKQVVEEKIKATKGATPNESEIKSAMLDYDPAKGADTIKRVLFEDSKLIEGRMRSLESMYNKNIPRGAPKLEAFSQEALETKAKFEGKGKGDTNQTPVTPRPTGISNIQLHQQALELAKQGKDISYLNKQLSNWGAPILTQEELGHGG